MELSTTTVTEAEVRAPTPHRKNEMQEVQVCITQHAVMRIELTGPALICTIVAAIVCNQVLQPSFTSCLLALASVCLFIRNDYDNFLSLGPGGTPGTFLGYLKITYLRIFRLRDPFTAPEKTLDIFPSVGLLQRERGWLAQRCGPRPTIAGIAPQRQINQRGCPEMYQLLRNTLKRAALSHPESLRTAISCFEKSGLALFADHPINVTCRGEIAHVHDSDHSLHMNLHPDDAAVVLAKGWGERHPLSKGGWLGRYVPQQFLMVYAPRDRAELEVVCRIIEAAIFWVSGEQVDLKIEHEMIADSTPIVLAKDTEKGLIGNGDVEIVNMVLTH